MKKFLLAFVTVSMTLAAPFAQQLKKQSVQNTMWTAFGVPAGDPDAGNRAGFRWAGIIDTIQVRVDFIDNKFSVDGMLSWAAPLTSWNNSMFDTVKFLNVKETQFDFLGEHRSRQSYYLNFLVHPFRGFDIGMGTDLGWQVGPYPYTDGLAWMPTSHVLQGDLQAGGPSATKVVGKLSYAYKYAETALGVRYTYRSKKTEKELFQIGLSIPDWTKVQSKFNKNFTLNLGGELRISIVRIALAYENLIHSGGNLYTGISVNIREKFILDAWFGANGIGYDKDTDTAGKKIVGFGAALKLTFGSVWLRPEIGYSHYMYSQYTSSFYVAGRVQWDFAKMFHLGAFTSFAWGAKDARWDDKNSSYYQKDFGRGFIWNLRPDFTIDFNERHSLSATFEYQISRNPDKTKQNGFAIGIFWKYNRAF